MTGQHDSFDLVVIGGGPGGYKAALLGARRGARVALVEAGQPGGNCLNQGCVPKKAMIYLARLLEQVENLHGKGLHGVPVPDLAGAYEHRDRVVQDMRQGFPIWLRRLGVQYFDALGHFASDGTVVAVSGDSAHRLEASRVILATGSVPRHPPACPRDGHRLLDSRDLLAGRVTITSPVLCVGGGPAGTEFAYFLARFGYEVTLVEQGNRLLETTPVPERAADRLADRLRKLGVTIRFGCTPNEIRHSARGVHITLSDGTASDFGTVMLATGRTPRTGELGLSEAGIRCDRRGFIQTNRHLETTAPGIYAIGDVKAGPLTANAAFHDAKVAVANALAGARQMTNYHRVPFVVDSALEIACVGLTEEQAEAAGFEPEAARLNFAASAKARGRNDTQGFIEVVHDEETGQLLGGCIAGPEAGEQIQMLTAACQSPKGLWTFEEIAYAHPSWSEELGNAVEPCLDELRLSPRLFVPGLYADTLE